MIREAIGISVPARPLGHLAPVARHGHERWDGNGYPASRSACRARDLGEVDLPEAQAVAQGTSAPVTSAGVRARTTASERRCTACSGDRTGEGGRAELVNASASCVPEPDQP